MTYHLNDMPPQIDPTRITRYATAETATVGHRRHMGFMDPAIQCVLPGKRVAGTAVTLALPGQDSTLLHHVTGLLRPGDFLCIDRLGDHKHACLGGGVAVAIKESGCFGVAIDGPCTDLPEIQRYDLPVWSRGVSPITTRLYDIGGSLNVPISCGGAVVMPGDVVIADFSGVLVMPPDEADADVDWALDKQASEPDMHRRAQAGEQWGAMTGASAKVRAKTGGEKGTG